MSLRRMQVTDFRCLHQAEVEFDLKFTLISGPNASGKTSLLEAIYVLGRGRSFRTRRLNHLIRSGSERMVILGEIDIGERRLALGVEGSADGLRARVAGERAGSLAELASVFPVQIIDPEVHRLIEEGPSRRRRFMDWAVFHVEPQFVGHWQSYYQVLRQRNAALRRREPRLWCARGMRIRSLWGLLSEARARYIEPVDWASSDTRSRPCWDMELDLCYRPGWPRNMRIAGGIGSSAGHRIRNPARPKWARSALSLLFAWMDWP